MDRSRLSSLIALWLVLASASVAVALDAPKASDQADATGARGWAATAVAQIRRHLVRPPKEVVPAEVAAEVLVRFRAERSGRVLDAAISKSSGFPELDGAALDAVRSSSPLPALIWMQNDTPQDFTLPIRFSPGRSEPR